MAEGLQERTEEATPQRREEFRRQGRVAQSRELVMVLSLLSLIITFYFYGKTFLSESENLVRHWIQRAATDEDFSTIFREFVQVAIVDGAKLIWPLLAFGFVTAILTHVGQIGVVFSTEPLTPDFGRINPLRGIQRFFSVQGAIETVKSILKFVIIGWVGYYQFLKFAHRSVTWSNLTVQEQVVLGASCLGEVAVALIIVLLFLGIFDLLFQKLTFAREIRMTKQELKEEVKMREGDPLIRARIRSIQRDRAMRRMMQQVPKADVIITNPTHFAVALIYEHEKMDAPRVLAKGADLVAERIKEVARRHSIPILENKPLARILYRTVKIGAVIPRDLYHAVAEVLAYVYKLRRRMSAEKR